MNKSRFYDEMDIQAVESKLNDVTVTAIPMSNVGSKSYHHQNQKSGSGHNYSSSSSKSQKNQSQQQYLNYQQNQLVQSAIELIKQQQLQQQRQQLLENGVSINSTSHAAAHAASHSGSASGSHAYANYAQHSNTNGAQLASVMSQSSSQNSGLSKYAQLLAVIEEMGRDIRPTYAMGRGDRLKRLIIQAKVLVRECLMETERSARQ